MRQTLQSRLSALEATPRPPQAAQPAPMTEDDCMRWCFNSFYRNKLQVADGVVRVNYRQAREHEHKALESMADAINRWRESTGNHPFLPITDDDATKALELLRAGQLKPVMSTYTLISMNYKWSWEYNSETARICDALDRALGVYLASGGNDGQPYRDGEVEELLTSFLERAEVNA